MFITEMTTAELMALTDDETREALIETLEFKKDIRPDLIRTIALLLQVNSRRRKN